MSEPVPVMCPVCDGEDFRVDVLGSTVEVSCVSCVAPLFGLRSASLEPGTECNTRMVLMNARRCEECAGAGHIGTTATPLERIVMGRRNLQLVCPGCAGLGWIRADGPQLP